MTAASPTSRKKEVSLLVTTRLVIVEACTATHVRDNNVFLPFMAMLLSGCLPSLSACSGCSEATNSCPNYFLLGAICLNDQSVFNSDGTASFVSNKAEFGGEMRDKKQCTLCYSPQPNLLTYGNEQHCLLIYSHLQMHTVAQTIVPQGLIFSWLQEFTYLWWQYCVFRRPTNL